MVAITPTELWAKVSLVVFTKKLIFFVLLY